MAVALGEGDVKTVEDLAGLVPDDLRGWFESKDGERVREPGILEAFALSPDDAEALIMRARVVMGWVEARRNRNTKKSTTKKRAASMPKLKASSRKPASWKPSLTKPKLCRPKRPPPNWRIVGPSSGPRSS